MDEQDEQIEKFFKLTETQEVIKRVYDKSQLCFPSASLDYQTVGDRLMTSCKSPYSHRHRAALTKKSYDDLISAVEMLRKRLNESGIDTVIGGTFDTPAQNLWVTDVLDKMCEWLKLLKAESPDIIKTRVSALDGNTAEDKAKARLDKNHLSKFIGAIYSTLVELGIEDAEALEIVNYFFKGLHPLDWKNLDKNRSTFVKTHCGLLSK